MSETANLLSETLDIAEETMDILEHQTDQMTNGHPVIVYGLVGAIIGGTVGYLVTKRFMKAKYEQIVEEEIANAKEFYRALNKKEDFRTPAKAAEKLHPDSLVVVTEAADAIRSYQGEDGDDEDDYEEEVEEVGEVEVFLEDHPEDDDWDIEEEMKTRTPDAPYIISSEEFMLNEPENSQTTLTYYLGDGTLADEREQEIPFVEPVVGEENLYHFGRGSGDDNLVYIRNERLGADYEVVKSDGKYAYEVLGFQHSDGGARGRIQENEPRRRRGEFE